MLGLWSKIEQQNFHNKNYLQELALVVFPFAKRMHFSCKKVVCSCMHACVCLDWRTMGAMQMLTKWFVEFGQGKSHKTKMTHTNAHFESDKIVCRYVLYARMLRLLNFCLAKLSYSTFYIMQFPVQGNCFENNVCYSARYKVFHATYLCICHYICSF